MSIILAQLLKQLMIDVNRQGRHELPSTHHCNDFASMLPHAFVDAAVKATREVLGIWGVTVFKDKESGPAFTALGVRFHLSGATAAQPRLIVSKELSRIKELMQHNPYVLFQRELAHSISCPAQGETGVCNIPDLWGHGCCGLQRSRQTRP